ncbi:MAG: ribonuclease R [Verrucomicrobia bacterium]|nr:ribonuclease R [Verrucomicrobiota bacterium]
MTRRSTANLGDRPDNMNSKDKQLAEQVRAEIEKHKDDACSVPEIASALRLRGGEKKRLPKILHRMEIGGEIVRIRNDRYSLGAAADLLTGVLDVARSGNGFVTGTGAGADIFVLQADVGTALPGDKVVVRVDPDSGGESGTRMSGKIIRILDRTQKDIVGTLKITGRFNYVVPMNPAYQQDFYVADAKGAKAGDRVVVRFYGWENRHVNPEGEIVEVIGPADNPSLDTISVIRHHGLKEEFSAAVLSEAETVASLVDRPGPRMDLRNKFILTIDPVRARDFDDALSLETDSAGNRVLGVHIADVSHYVKLGSALDLEARERGNSVYLPDKVLPMLPEQLSNGVCSLKPDEDRLTFSAFLTINNAGDVIGARFAKSIIRSRLRLTYEEALAALQLSLAGKPAKGKVGGAAQTLLRGLHDLAQQFRRKRFGSNALDLDVPEIEFEIGADGMICGISVSVNDVSHQLVEECMVAANEAVAAEVAKRGLTVISRVHEPPKMEKIEDLTMQLLSMGIKPGDLTHRGGLARFLKTVEKHPLAFHIRVAVLRSMNRAMYSPEILGHFGLSKKYYAHFTSPIRRYPDLVLHRQLEVALQETDGQARAYTKDEIASVSQHCSRTEFVADQAERDIIEIKKYRYLEQQLKRRKPEVYDAVVVNVTNFGMFIEITDLQMQGLVHISSISSKFVRYDRARHALVSGRDTFKLGSRVSVRVNKVDFDKRQIDFVLAGK